MTDDARDSSLQSDTATSDVIVAENLSSDVPQFFSDGLYHMGLVNGVARLSFAANFSEPLGTPAGEQGWRVRHVAMVNMPVEQVRGMVAYIERSLAMWTEQGVIGSNKANGD